MNKKFNTPPGGAGVNARGTIVGVSMEGVPDDVSEKSDFLSFPVLGTNAP